jgi:hypothetical protein
MIDSSTSLDTMESGERREKRSDETPPVSLLLNLPPPSGQQNASLLLSRAKILLILSFILFDHLGHT